MSKKEQTPKVPPAKLPVRIHAQYVRDMSFENPNAPETLRLASTTKPEMDVTMNISARKLKDEKLPNLYEVTLQSRIVAKGKDKALFLIDVDYAAAVSMHEELEEQQHHPILMIEVPKLMFPYLRQIVSNASQNGGFIPLMLEPVDFAGMYMARFTKHNEKDEKSA